MFDPTRPVVATIHHLYADREGPCRSRYFRLVIHPDLDHMRAAAKRYDRKRFGPADSYDNAGGLWQPRPFASRYDRKTRRWIDTSSACAGVMRLARGHLDGEVIAHESTHAALHISRLHAWWLDTSQAPERVVIEDMATDEEPFAYLLGGIAGEVGNLVWRYEECG